ncbi:MAG: hypothetical protein EOP04_10705 [Proteobacteria bacterium]|nr:MAG: hypothetical protein EOP04_10705 [Pseudomonadota bacterium]
MRQPLTGLPFYDWRTNVLARKDLGLDVDDRSGNFGVSLYLGLDDPHMDFYWVRILSLRSYRVFTRSPIGDDFDLSTARLPRMEFQN